MPLPTKCGGRSVRSQTKIRAVTAHTAAKMNQANRLGFSKNSEVFLNTCRNGFLTDFHKLFTYRYLQ
jgi:hypothetical protein